MPLSLHNQAQAFEGGTAIFAQVGWVGHREQTVYGLDDSALHHEPGGVTPLYIQVGTYVLWED